MTTMGRSAVGQAQGLGPGYPFARSDADRDYLLADFYLAYEDPADYNSDLTDFVLPLHLAWVYGLDVGADGSLADWIPTPTHAADLLVVDANGDTVFDSTTATYFTDHAFTDRLRVLEWRTATATCQLVVHTGWGPDDVQVTFPLNFVPDDSELDPSTYHRRAKRVRSVGLLMDSVAKGNLELLSGYNTTLRLTTRTENNRLINSVEVNFDPGSGIGTYDDCADAEIVLRTVNGIAADTNGDLKLVAKDCLNIFEPTVLVGSPPQAVPSWQLDTMAPQLVLRDDCPPCCGCDDYVAEANDLLAVRDNYAQIGSNYRQLVDLYSDNIDRWNAVKDCALSQPLRLIMQPQNCPYVDVAAQFCNQTSRCRRDVSLRIRFSSLPNLSDSCYPTSNESVSDPLPTAPRVAVDPPVGVVAGSTYITTTMPRGLVPYTLAGGWCDYRAYFDAVNPFESVYVRFRLQLPDAGLSGGKPYAIQGLLDAVVDGTWLEIPDGSKAAATQAVVVKCPQVTTVLTAPGVPARNTRVLRPSVSVTVHYDSIATIFTRVIPANALIEQITIFVDESFDTAATLEIGTPDDTSKYVASDRSYLDDTAETRFDIYPALPPDLSPQSLIITYDRNGASVGTARVVVRYSA